MRKDGTTICAIIAFAILPKVALGQGIITTLAGNSIGPSVDGSSAVGATLQSPGGVAVDAAGTVYFSDTGQFRIRKIDPLGIISTVAGNGTLGFSGDGGVGTSAAIFPPTAGHHGLAVDRAGDLYIADFSNGRVRKLDSAGTITTFAGVRGLFDPPGPRFAGDGGPASSAALNSIFDIAFDGAGNLYIADTLNIRVRMVNRDGIINTVAGNGTLGFSGDGGPATSAAFNAAQFLAADNAGNLYIGDPTARRVRRVDAGGIITTYAGNGTVGTAGDGGPAVNAQFLGISALSVDGSGNLYIADSHRIRKVDAAGIITTVAGTGVAGFQGDGGPATAARISNPAAIAVDVAGNLYIADTGNNRIRKVTFPTAEPAPVVRAALNAASLNPAQAVVQGSLASLFGSNLARTTAQASTIPLPVSLGGVSVTVGGVAARLLFVSPEQINLQIPWSLNASAEAADVIVTANGVVSGVFRARLTSPAYGVFATQFGVGQAIAINPDGSLAGPSGSIPGVATRPARPGETIIVLATGLGPVFPLIADGAASSDQLRPAVLAPAVLIGGVRAQVSFAGLSPQFVGVYQVNAVVPNVPAGVVPLQLDFFGNSTSNRVTIAVGN